MTINVSSCIHITVKIEKITVNVQGAIGSGLESHCTVVKA